MAYKYVVNQKLELFDDISFKELYGRIKVVAYKIRFVPSYDKVFVFPKMMNWIYRHSTGFIDYTIVLTNRYIAGLSNATQLFVFGCNTVGLILLILSFGGEYLCRGWRSKICNAIA
jgi:hypothetical protein